MTYDKTKEVIKRVHDVLGTGAGAALGNLVGGPLGAVGGVVAGHAIKMTFEVLSDLVSRDLSKRERYRVGMAAEIALNRIQAYLLNNKKPRNDVFFSDFGSPAVEIFEGALLKCKVTHEENKIKYISNIFVNTSFMEDISFWHANHMLKVAEGLTYRQFCILAMLINFSLYKKFELSDEDFSDYEGTSADSINFQIETESQLQEFFDLYKNGLIKQFDEEEGAYKEVIDSWKDINIKQIELTKLGEGLCKIMALGEMEEDVVTKALEHRCLMVNRDRDRSCKNTNVAKSRK